jgi:predicted amidohydrolase
VGDLDANLDKIRDFQRRAKKQAADLVVFPELTMTGYTMGDEIGKYALSDSHPVFQKLLDFSKTLPMIIGYAERSPRGRIYNSAALLDSGEKIHLHRKVYLPNYGVWEEQKRFAKGRRIDVCPYKGFRFAIFICNDFWFPSMGYLAASNDADVYVVIANSALDTDGMHPRAWDILIRTPALFYGAYVVFANRVGTEHGWSFWGGSTVAAPTALSAVAAETGEEILQTRLEYEAVEKARDALPILKDMDIDFTIRELRRLSELHHYEND